MVISTFARESGLSVDTVRFYVRQRLLIPARGLKGGSRPYQMFSDADLETARVIRLAQALGLTLKEIKAFVGEIAPDERVTPKILTFLTEQRERGRHIRVRYRGPAHADRYRSPGRALGFHRMTGRRDFSRQSFLGRDSERILAETRVAIVGLGGGGSHIAQQLAHLGVGNFRLIDPQEIEDSNLNRLVGGTEKDVIEKIPKVGIAERLIRGIRPWAEVKTEQTQWQKADDLLKDAHVVFGCVDGYRQRMYLEGAARRYFLPYIDIGMDVTELDAQQYAVAGQMIMVLPGGPCMKCLGFLTQQRLDREENDYGDAGINPQVVWTNGTLASLAVGAFVRLLTPWFDYKRDFEWLELDGNNQLVSQSRQPEHTMKGPCRHFSSGEVGDPFFDLRETREREQT
jgi:molybdopterin-synthase adenylyltransferase